MKEVMCIIRLNKITKTKNALSESGFPSFTCRKVLGRGKKSIDEILGLQSIVEVNEEIITSPYHAESFSEKSRLVPKRLITLVVNDDDVKRVVDIVISSNSTQSPGDGRIFVLPIDESYRIRDGQKDTESIEI